MAPPTARRMGRVIKSDASSDLIAKPIKPSRGQVGWVSQELNPSYDSDESRHSVTLQAGRFHDRRPLLRVGSEEGGKFGRRADLCLPAELDQAGLDLGRFETV